MSTSMRSPPTVRKTHAPVQVPGFHRGSFTIPAQNMQQSSSSTGLRNNQQSISENRSLFHIESESEQVGLSNASQRLSKK